MGTYVITFNNVSNGVGFYLNEVTNDNKDINIEEYDIDWTTSAVCTITLDSRYSFATAMTWYIYIYGRNTADISASPANQDNCAINVSSIDNNQVLVTVGIYNLNSNGSGTVELIIK